MSGPYTEDPARRDAAHWIARAIAETLAYGGHDRAAAQARLLDIDREELLQTAEDRRAVLAWFGENLDEDDEPAERALVGPPINAAGW